MTASTCESFEGDELFQNLLSPDIPGGSYSGLSFADQIKHLSDGLDKISLELQSQVRQQHGALLSQASHAGKLGVALDAVCGHMERLQAGADRLKNQMQGPFDQVQHQTHVLERLHSASHLLRQSGRFLQLSRKLGSTNDARLQSTLLNELEPLANDPTLAKIAFVRDERAVVLSARQRMNTVANNDLLTGLKAASETQVSNSLQIFANLQTLSTCLHNILTTFIDEIRQSLRECFAGTQTAQQSAASTASGRGSKTDRREPKRGPGKTPALTTSQNFRSKLWTAINWLFEEEIHSQCVQILFLQNCMQFVQLPSTEQTVDATDIERRYWTKLEDLLRSSFGECAIHVRQCLQQDLPKLLAAARGLQAKFGTTFVFDHNVFEILEAGYLEQSAVNLKASLVGTDCPKQETVDVLLRSASAQLSAAMVDQSLCLLVANALNACNSDFLTKIEAHVKLGTDSMQVIDIPNAAQIRNTQLANTVHYHSEQTRRMVQNLGNVFASSAAAEIILKDLTKNEKLICKIVQQLFDSMSTATNTILLSMHREPGLNNPTPATAPTPTNVGPSLYMKELQEFLHRSWNLHIVGFTDRKCVDCCGKELAEKCIELFVRNAAILRPLSAAGRARLRSDCQHLEAALKPMVDDLSTFGRPYRQIRAFATLLMMSAEELSRQPTEQDGPVAPIFVLFLLFGHAAPALTSPHTSAGWSNEKLLEWLDGHRSERERLELVNGALQRYRTIVRQRNIAQYDPVYPLIAGYVEQVAKVVNQ